MVEDGALVMNPSHMGCYKLADAAVAKAARTRTPRVKSDATKSDEEKPAKAAASKPAATKKAPAKKAPGMFPCFMAGESNLTDNSQEPARNRPESLPLRENHPRRLRQRRPLLKKKKPSLPTRWRPTK